MKKLLVNNFTLYAIALLISASSCKKDGASTAPILKNDVNVATSPSYGRYLVTKNGLTLYMFANDADGISSCTGDCGLLWPAFIMDLGNLSVDSTLKVTDFATVTNFAGKKQVTYRGWPLYTYSPSANTGYGGTGNAPETPGSIGGDGFMGIWFVANPDYTIMLANNQLKGQNGNLYKNDYSLGQGLTTYFTDGAGRTLYTFALDSFNTNKFTKPDLSNNTTFPVYEQESAVVPSILNKSLFRSITVGGKKQLTYKGWPLYYFGEDAVRGSNKAVSVPTTGVWPVAVKDMAEAAK